MSRSKWEEPTSGALQLFDVDSSQDAFRQEALKLEKVIPSASIDRVKIRRQMMIPLY